MKTMNHPRLTQEFAYKVKTKKTKERFPDHVVVGMSLRVMRSGAKAWVILYRKPDLSSGEMKIGSVDTMTLKMAREVARQKLAEVSLGANPIEDKVSSVTKAQAKRARTLVAIIENYRNSAHYLNKRPSTRATYDNSLNGYIIPALGRCVVEDVKRANVSIFLDQLTKEQSGNVANHARSALSVVMAFALERDLIDFNPVQGVKRTHKTSRKERPLDDGTLQSLWQALEEGDRVTPIVGSMLRLLMFVPVRVNELSGMSWAELDFAEGLWTIPKDRMKGHERHELPLGTYSLGILRELRCQTNDSTRSKWVFPNEAGTGPIARTVPTRAIARIVEKRELAKFSPHDLRHTCATRLARMGMARDVVERLLGHRVGAGRAIINYDHHDYREQKLEALKAWEKVLLEVLEVEAL